MLALAFAALLPLAFAAPVANEVPVIKRDGTAGVVMDPMPNTTLAPYPTYRAMTDFDRESFKLALMQEWIELDLFHYGVATFTSEQWSDMGVGPEYLHLLEFMANQETGHAQLITDILGAGNAPERCTYNYTGAFTDPRSYVAFNAELTSWGERGVIGFLAQLNSRDSALLLHQSISTESRQQMVFRQFAGAFPMPVWFETGIPQAWAWTLLAPYIQTCPTNSTADYQKIGWTNFPKLTIADVPRLIFNDSKAAVSTNRTALTQPGQQLNFTWEAPGKAVGPDQAYTTAIKTNGTAKYALFVSQLNATYTPLTSTGDYSAYTYLPDLSYVFNTTLATGQAVLNGTNFVALTSDNPVVTSANLTKINDYVVAGPAIISFG